MYVGILASCYAVILWLALIKSLPCCLGKQLKSMQPYMDLETLVNLIHKTGVNPFLI